jgi:hypothetical protein
LQQATVRPNGPGGQRSGGRASVSRAGTSVDGQRGGAGRAGARWAVVLVVFINGLVRCDGCATGEARGI